ncbi:MAG: PQQ-like beta-propeller repeat protein [Candidatus Margulisbacteria bacterium]|nr:PQQ-like beta-propeller repeat protein [Candidatus Margulisiibacteriota bacterium]MBU1022522.1 PQQ-like beta-propeller repeat protein [Candidatus Margulisiibacteriota bacterium]
MKNLSKLLILIVIPFLTLSFYNGVQAKRMAPQEVEPVIHNGVKYSAPHEKMGYVVARDQSTGKKLWERKVYSVVIDPNLETDVQQVFITDLNFEDGKLMAVNEEGNQYEIDIATESSSGKVVWIWIGIFLILILGSYLLYRFWVRPARLERGGFEPPNSKET